MNRRMNALLEKILVRLSEAEDADLEAMLMDAAEEVASKYADTSFIMGGPSVSAHGGKTVLKANLKPYNDAKIDSFLVVHDGAKVHISVYGSFVPEGGDVETSGFGQTSAQKSYSTKALTASKLAKLIVGLAGKQK